MDVMTAVLTRRSEHRLVEPSPSMEELTYLLKAASCAADHGRLRPWRWLLVSGDDRRALGEVMAECNGKSVESMVAKTHRAPLLAGLILSPDTRSRVPEWEQLAAATGMVTSLMLLLHARGFGSIWRTGEQADAAPMRRFLSVDEHERALGWLYMGTPVRDGSVARRRQPLDVGSRLQVFSTPNDVEPQLVSARR